MTGRSSEGSSLLKQLLDGMDAKELEQRAAAAAAREQENWRQARARMNHMIHDNSTLPTTLHSIRIIGAHHTRKGFLENIVQPALNANTDRPYTLTEALAEVQSVTDKLNRLDIFHYPVVASIQRPDKTDPSTTPTDIDIELSVKEKSRILLKTGTEVGNAEGAAYAQVLARNIFGGAESCNLHASLGTRTRSAYRGTFDTPFFGNPDLRLEAGVLSSSTLKSWASHEEVSKEGWAKLKWLTKGGYKHELTYGAAWRQVTGLAENASRTVRNDAGDSTKSSLTHTFVVDTRDYPMMPSKGFYLKTQAQLAGWGPLRGDVASLKLDGESRAAIPVPIPGIKNSGITLTTGLGAGLLYPLTLSSQEAPKPSRINDRFTLGGPADVRGFRMAGLGPHDGRDAVGGDIYVSGGANLLLPLPRVGPQKPFRLQAFINSGRLLALPQMDSTSADRIRKNVASTITELANGLPSTAVGLGLVYAHPSARFELNFGVPLVQRRGENSRKGFQFGIGLELL